MTDACISWEISVLVLGEERLTLGTEEDCEREVFVGVFDLGEDEAAAVALENAFSTSVATDIISACWRCDKCLEYHNFNEDVS